jgi:hypothetical protein
MMTLELDDETADLLNALAEQEQVKPALLLKRLLLEHQEDIQDAQHDLKDVVKVKEPSKSTENKSKEQKPLLQEMFDQRNKKLRDSGFTVMEMEPAHTGKHRFRL